LRRLVLITTNSVEPSMPFKNVFRCKSNRQPFRPRTMRISSMIIPYSIRRTSKIKSALTKLALRWRNSRNS
jgi:hypothetical protein